MNEEVSTREELEALIAATRIRELEAALADEKHRIKSSHARLIGKIGAETSWVNTKDRTARTAPARAKFEQRFLDQADGDPVRAAHLRKAYFARMALASAKARRKRKEEARGE